MNISDAQARFSSLISSRANSRNILQPRHPHATSPLRVLGESLLNRFAFQLSDQAVMAEQHSSMPDDILENLVSSLALAGMLGVDLEKELANLLNLLEAVSAEAS